MTPLEKFTTAALCLFILIAVAAFLARPVLRVGQRVFDLLLEGQRDPMLWDEVSR